MTIKKLIMTMKKIFDVFVDFFGALFIVLFIVALTTIFAAGVFALLGWW